MHTISESQSPSTFTILAVLNFACGCVSVKIIQVTGPTKFKVHTSAPVIAIIIILAGAARIQRASTARALRRPRSCDSVSTMELPQ